MFSYAHCSAAHSKYDRKQHKCPRIKKVWCGYTVKSFSIRKDKIIELGIIKEQERVIFMKSVRRRGAKAKWFLSPVEYKETQYRNNYWPVV